MAKRSTYCGSLLFDCEVEETSSQEIRSTVNLAKLAAIEDRVAYLARPCTDFASKLLKDVRAFKRALVREGCASGAVVLALRLSLVGYQASVRQAIGGGSACFRNLRHEFISVRGPNSEEYIVELDFKEHFAIPKPSATYQKLVEFLATEFVGTSSSLVPLVQCLCMEMADSFQEQGLTLPPWRRSQAMLSKWLPARSRDRGVSYSGNSDSEGASPDACSPRHIFSRIDDFQMAERSNSSKSLLSGRLNMREDQQQKSQQQPRKGAVSSHPIKQIQQCAPVHWSQPPSYVVKMGSASSSR